MDIFLHIVVNAAIANQLSRDENSQRACILGGIVPDLDVIFAWIPFIIPQLLILQHRGLFHTVIAAPFIAGAIIGSTEIFKKINFGQRLEESFKALYTELNYRSFLWGVSGRRQDGQVIKSVSPAHSCLHLAQIAMLLTK